MPKHVPYDTINKGRPPVQADGGGPPSVKGRPATQRDVAAFARVNPSTVSRVLNDDPQLTVSPETRAKIFEGVERLGYVPNLMARGLRLSRTWTIGLLIPDLSNPVYGQIAEGAQVRAEVAGYGLVLGSPTDDHQAIDVSFTRLLNQGRVDGLLIASASMEDDAIRSMTAGARPIVFLNRRVAGEQGTVITNDAAGASMATQYLLRLGHRRLAHLGGPDGVDTSERRRQGFETAASGAETSAVVAARAYDADAGYEAGRELILGHRGTTAVFAANVMIAIGFLRAAAEAGLRVPEDLSVIALHDFPLAAFTQPPLTTVALPLREMGAAAVELLLETIDGGRPASRIIDIAPQLIVRGSVAPPISAQ